VLVYCIWNASKRRRHPLHYGLTDSCEGPKYNKSRVTPQGAARHDHPTRMTGRCKPAFFLALPIAVVRLTLLSCTFTPQMSKHTPHHLNSENFA
jgi:hypothetical protein